MATPVTYSGVSYSIPAFGDVGYAQGPGNLSSYLIALASGPQTTGGLFSLTAPLNFGPNFGLIAVNYTSTTANPATAGSIRLAKTDTIDWRNNANGANLALGINVSDQLTFNGVVLSTPATGGTVSAGVAGRLTLYPAAGNTVDDIYVQNSQNIDILIVAQAARSVALEYSIPNPGNAVAAATFALLELAQTFTATQTFAAATFTGLITGVNATLSGLLTLSATTNQLVLGTTNTVTITSPAPAASRVYTIPDVLGAASFVMTAGAQSIAGVKTFTGGAGAITLSASTIAMGANKITGLANGTAATDAVAFGQLKVVQAGIQTVSSTATSTTSSTYQACTNQSVAITPISASNRVRVYVSTVLSNASALTVPCLTLKRGATDLSGLTFGFARSDFLGFQSVSFTFIDSPATTSATTYQLFVRSFDNTNSVTCGRADLSSIITAEEIV